MLSAFASLALQGVALPTPRAAAAPAPSPPVQLRIEQQPDPRRYYPKGDLGLAQGGLVLVGLGVRLDGTVTRCLVERSSGSLPLDEAACKLARGLRFEPAPASQAPARVEYACCTRVEIIWGGGTARVRSLFNSRRAYHPNMGRLVSSADYPAAAKRARLEGRVGFVLDIDSNGRVANCTIYESSNIEVLDQATCRILRERLIMAPARNEAGIAVPDSVQSRIVWRL